MKILFYDLETSPNVSYTWGKWEQNVIAFQKEWELLSFAYKWLDDPKVHCITRADFRDKTDKAITKSLARVLNEADIVVAHNGDAFDNKKTQAKLIEHGLPPTQPFKSVDTLKVARNRFKFNSNKLDDLGKLLKVGRKVKTTAGFDLWLRCMDGDKAAFKELAAYNKQDVVLLEKVYKCLLPWIKHPHVGGAIGCPRCGSKRLQRRGESVTLKSVYRRYQCQECGGWLKELTPYAREIKTKAVL